MKVLETVWQMKSTYTGRVLTCGIYRTAGPGLEVRCGYGKDDLLRSQSVAEIGGGRELATSGDRRWSPRAALRPHRLMTNPGEGRQ
jgi:hypothetical protein